MDVAAEMNEIFIFEDGICSKWSFKQCTPSSVHFVEGFAVAVENSLHKTTESTRPILSKYHVIMIGHQAVGNYGDLPLARVLFEALS